MKRVLNFMFKRVNFSKSKTKEHLLSNKQIARIKQHIEYEDEQLLFYGLLYTGMRISEFIHMRRDWLDFDEMLIRIPREIKCLCQSCKKDKVHPNIWRTKTKAAARIIPILPEVHGRFLGYFSDHKKIMVRIKSRRMAYYYLHKLGERAGVKLFPHQLRGTFATLLAEKEFTHWQILSVLGWTDIKTAMEYITLSGARIKRAFDQKWSA